LQRQIQRKGLKIETLRQDHYLQEEDFSTGSTIFLRMRFNRKARKENNLDKVDLPER
jgi:hypothetical protein